MCSSDLDEAAGLLEKGSALAPLDNRCRLDRIRVLAAMGNPPQAKALAEESATILSAFPGAESLVEHFRRLAAGL